MPPEQTPPGYTGQCFPDTFNKCPFDTPNTPSKSGQLPKEQIDRYFRDGYILVENFFELSQIEECLTSLGALVDDLAQELFDAGKISKTYDGVDVLRKLPLINTEFPGAGIIIHKRGIMPQAIRKLWSDERLLNLIEQLIGPDISGHPVWNIRTKIPGGAFADVPWHQDNGYLPNEAYNVHIPTMWIPFVDTNVENGTLELVRGGHKTGKTAVHTCCHGGTWYVTLDEKEMIEDLKVDPKTEARTVPVNRGSFLLFNNLIPHRSLPNVSDHTRWSCDLRFVSTNAPDTFGLKPSLPLRKKDDPKHDIEWEQWLKLDRQSLRNKLLNKKEDTRFDTTIAGTWMQKWEIVHHNDHTQSFKPQNEGNDWMNKA